MIAFKFLGFDATGLFSGFRWPVGEWVEVEGPLVGGRNGIHACRIEDVPLWIDDELWLAELGDELREEPGLLLARRGRLLRRIEAWDGAAARSFAEECVRRASDRLRLQRGETDDLRSVQTVAVSAAARAEGHLADTLLYLADSVELALGGRPDRYTDHPALSGSPTPGALAANLGFVTAHTAGHAAGGPDVDAERYAAAFEAERSAQLDWLVHRLELRRELEPAFAS